jgi:predicted nucleotidyltransferase
MKLELLNISDKLDPFSLEVLKLVIKCTGELKIKTFVIGASAIDIVFEKIHNITIHRATNDIDFSIRVKSWAAYSKLIEKLKDSGFASSKIVHRFSYKSIPSIDIIPFGGISLSNHSIIWPDKESKEMNVLGYEECLKDSIIVRIQEEPPIDVNIASPRGLVLLKLMSWKDASPNRSRDAIDILYIIRNYIDAGNSDRLYTEHNDLVDNNFDYELTGAILLGRDIASFADSSTLLYVIDILENEIKNLPNSTFINDMLKSDFSSFRGEKKFDHYVSLVKNLLHGLNHLRQ